MSGKSQFSISVLAFALRPGSFRSARPSTKAAARFSPAGTSYPGGPKRMLTLVGRPSARAVRPPSGRSPKTFTSIEVLISGAS
jgi:hypothetical protein